MRYFYSLLIWLLVPAALLYFLLRSRREPAYRSRLTERLGYGPTVQGRPVWIHAASVGEADAAILLAIGLLRQDPSMSLWMTTFTPTGADRIRRALMGQGEFADRVGLSFLPLDTPAAVRRFLKRLNPRVGLIVERELWPNLYRQCAARHIPLAVISARWTEPSMQRYRRLFGERLLRDSMQALQLIAAQSQTDAATFVAAGVEEGRVAVAGNVKYDLGDTGAEDTQAAAWRKAWQAQQRSLWVAGSTHAGEEETALRIHQRLLQDDPEALLVMAPRHPQRFERVAALCEQSGLLWERLSVLKAQPVGAPAKLQLILADTLGDLKSLYAAADLAFVGGSLVPAGGHNLFEALACGTAVITGNQLSNWQLLADEMQAAGCLHVVADEAELSESVLVLLRAPEQRQAMLAAGQPLLARHRGALARTLALLAPLLDSQGSPGALR